MSMIANPILSSVWSQLITELLATQTQYVALSDDQVRWGKQHILTTLSKLTPTKIYKNLIYMNRRSKIGKFALVYAHHLTRSIIDGDESRLCSLIADVTTPEYDANPRLTNQELADIASQLNTEMITMNALVDTVSRMASVPSVLLGDTVHEKCSQDVCLYAVESPNLRNTPNPMVDRTLDPMVWVTDSSDSSDIHFAWCYRLPELIGIIVCNGNNTYTGEPFSAKTCDMVSRRYVTEFKLMRCYFDEVTKATPTEA